MLNFFIRRFLQMIITLIGVSFILFILFSLIPGDALSSENDPRLSYERKQELRHIYHLDDPKPVQYFYWLKEVVTKGNFGNSFYFNRPVLQVMKDFIPNSFLLSLISLIIALIIAIPIGIYSATKQYSFFDGFFMVFSIIGISMPSMFFALLLIKYLGVDLKILPFSGMRTAGVDYTGFGSIIDILKHMALPLIVLTFSSLASWMRYTRSSMLEVSRQDYIRTARAKGLNERSVTYKHGFRNALIPIVTLLGLSIPGLFSGATITEFIFNWPGIGPVQLSAVANRDYYLLMGLNMLLAVFVLLGNFLSDILYAIVDPRIRLK